MSKKLLTRLLALTMCAGLILQPVTAYAQEVDAEADLEEIVLEEAAEEDIEIGGGHIIIDEFPEISGVSISDNMLYWDQLGECRLYLIEIGDAKEVVKYFPPLDLEFFCEISDVPFGSYTVKITAVNGVEVDSLALSKTAEIPWVYGKPTPVEKTKITKIEATSNMGEFVKFGEPTKAPDFTFADYEGIVVTGGRWLKRTSGGERVESTEETFSLGDWFYEVELGIDDEHKDLYEFDQYMQLYVDGVRWTGIDVATFRCPGISVIDEENRVTLKEINATSDIPEIFVNGGTYRTPNITNDDGIVYFSSMYTDKKDGDNWKNIYAFGPTLTEGEYVFYFIMSLKDDYVYTHKLTEETKVIIDGLECTMVSTGTIVGDGMIMATFRTGVIEIKGEEPIEPDDPDDPANIEGGIWKTKWGATYYETEDGQKLSGVQKIDGEYYLFSANGTLQKNMFHEEGEKKYYFGSDGKAVKGWLSKWNATYRFDDEFVMMKGFADIDEDTYYFNAKGHLIKSSWITEDGKKYYAKGDGTLAKSETIKKWGKKYSFDADGVLLP